MIRSLHLLHRFCNKYKVLGVKQTASSQTIKQRYFQLAKLYHPDTHPDPANIKKFQQIKSAYQTLIDENLRYQHDMKEGLESEWKLRSGLKHARFTNDEQYEKILNEKPRVAVFDEEKEIERIYEENREKIDEMKIWGILGAFKLPMVILAVIWAIFNLIEVVMLNSEEKKRLTGIEIMKGGVVTNAIPLDIT